MKITYLGTAAAEGFPAMFCNCASCKQARKNLEREMRTRSQVLIDDKLLIDFPADSYYHSLKYGIDFSAVKYLLVTHSHTDHFYGAELVNRGYKFAHGMRSERLEIFGNSEVFKVFIEETSREIRQEVSEKIAFRTIVPFSFIKVGEYEIFALPAVHTEKENALVYCISSNGKTLLYLNDTAILEEETLLFLFQKGIKADMVSMDCTLGVSKAGISKRHMGFTDNEILRNKLVKYSLCDTNTKYYVTHFSHNSAPFRDNMESEAKKRGMIAAHDGLVVEI